MLAQTIRDLRRFAHNNRTTFKMCPASRRNIPINLHNCAGLNIHEFNNGGIRAYVTHVMDNFDPSSDRSDGFSSLAHEVVKRANDVFL